MKSRPDIDLVQLRAAHKALVSNGDADMSCILKAVTAAIDSAKHCSHEPQRRRQSVPLVILATALAARIEGSVDRYHPRSEAGESILDFASLVAALRAKDMMNEALTEDVGFLDSIDSEDLRDFANSIAAYRAGGDT